MSEPRTKRSLWIRQLWLYTLAIWFGIGSFICLLAGDIRLMIPISSLSIIVGLIGTLLVILELNGDISAKERRHV